jgi:hypothetical protein
MIRVRYDTLNQTVKHAPQTLAISPPSMADPTSNKVAMDPRTGQVIFMHKVTKKWEREASCSFRLHEYEPGDTCFVARRGKTDAKGRPLFYLGTLLGE